MWLARSANVLIVRKSWGNTATAVGTCARLTHGVHHRHAIHSFLTWAISQDQMPRLDVPVLQFARGQALTHEQRSALLRRFAAGDGTPLDRRVAACLMLLRSRPRPWGSTTPPPSGSSPPPANLEPVRRAAHPCPQR